MVHELSLDGDSTVLAGYLVGLVGAGSGWPFEVAVEGICDALLQNKLISLEQHGGSVGQWVGSYLSKKVSAH